MAILLSVILVILGIMNISVGMLSRREDTRSLYVNKLFFNVCVSSALWCIGYALMAIAPQEGSAYLLRAVALFGVFSCCASIVRYTQSMSGIYFKRQKIFDIFLICGAIICFVLVAHPGAVRFTDTVYGRYYVFKPWIGRYVQYIYLVILFAVCLWISCIWLKRAAYRREKRMAGYLMAGALVISAGAFFDAVFPLFQLPAFPSSAISTFVYIQILYSGLRQHNDTRISSARVSEHIFETIATPVIIMDETLTIFDCNDKAGEYLGGTREELLGSKADEWLRYVYSEDAQRLRVEILNQSEKIEVRAFIRTTGSACNIVFTPVYDRYGEVLCTICILNDNTAYERIREQADQSTRRAQLSEAAKKEFIGRIDKKIKLPIHDNIVLLESLKAAPHSFSDGELERMEAMEKADKELLWAMDELLEHSQIQSGNFVLAQHKFDMEELLLEVFSEIAQSLDESKLRLITRISPSVPRIMTGDRQRLKYIFLSVLRNAAKYTGAGRIMFQLTSEVNFGTVNLHVKVSDTGCGIHEEDLNSIFGMQDENGENINDGSTLTLSLCSKMVKMMNGRMSIRSAPGTGTTVSFDMELFAEDEQGIVPYGSYKQKVLVIMDDQYKSEAVAYTLKELGMSCETMIRERIEGANLTEDDKVSLVLVGAGILNRMRAYLHQAYKYAKLVPVYSYKNYKLLESGEEGVCGTLIFSQIKEILRRR